MAGVLSESGQYRVLRRLKPRSLIEQLDGSDVRVGLFLDVETTGLDPEKDEVIELAMVPFTYGADGSIFEVRKAFQQLQQPKNPILALVTSLTGITDEMVAGHIIDSKEVASFIGDASLIIAHNARFDRRFVERLSEAFVAKPWACSMTQIDWASEGFEGTRLPYLAMGAGFFYDHHRAENDCFAAIELLATPLPKSGVLAMAKLLERARRPTWRIWAEHAPFDLKDVLKARGYRWNGDGNGAPRAWYVDVEDEFKEQELAYLRAEIYQRDLDPLVRKITAYERFSDRC